MESRKCVRFEISAGKRVSGQTSIHAKKKHRCVRFGRDGAVGVVEKMTTAQIRVVAAKDPSVRVRAMGGDVTSLSGSPAFVVAEVQDSENLLSRLQQQVERLEAQVEKLEASMKKEKATRKEEAREMVATNLIVNEGFTVCVRAFCDFVVHSFMQRAEKAHLHADNRAQWLEGKGAHNFVKGGGVLKVIDCELRIDAELLINMKKLRAFSVRSSRRVCHSFRPVQVAFGLHRWNNSREVTTSSAFSMHALASKPKA